MWIRYLCLFKMALKKAWHSFLPLFWFRILLGNLLNASVFQWLGHAGDGRASAKRVQEWQAAPTAPNTCTTLKCNHGLPLKPPRSSSKETCRITNPDLARCYFEAR